VAINVRVPQDIIDAMEDLKSFVGTVEEGLSIPNVKRSDVVRIGLLYGIRELQKRKTKQERAAEG
tara:strand:+ start:365 stop:559 length:195 start_codon:yes stop_codon:yes gene_type:complete